MADTPSFRRFGQAKANPTTEPKTVEAVVEKPAPSTPPSAAAPKVEKTTALSVFAKPSSAGALSTFLQAAEEKQAFDLFPVVNISGGNTGGMFDPASYLSDDMKRILPSGRNPVPAVVLAYRIALIAFPASRASATDKPGEKSARPSWTCVIPSHEDAILKVATKLTKNYQFTKKERRVKYDFDTSGVGHVKPTLCLLCYLPQQNLLVEIRTPNHYNSTERTGLELAQHFNGNGELEPFPCELAVETNVEGKDRPDPWSIHHIVFKAVTNDKKAEMGKAFASWQSAAQDDEDLVGNYTKWLNAGDRPLTDEIAERIQKGAGL